MSTSHDLSHLASMIKDIRYSMMTTIDSDGCLYSRPMANLKVDENNFDGRLWFFTNNNTPKVRSLKKDQHVNLAYTHIIKQHYVSISGMATLSDDREKMKELWLKDFKEWFPLGLEDPDLALICVTVKSAEIWDSSGKMVYLKDIAKAFFTGKLPLGEPGQIYELGSTQINRDDQNHVMTDEEKLDETSDESFPASDPPGHFSKSTVDRSLH